MNCDLCDRGVTAGQIISGFAVCSACVRHALDGALQERIGKLAEKPKEITYDEAREALACAGWELIDGSVTTWTKGNKWCLVMSGQEGRFIPKHVRFSRDLAGGVMVEVSESA